MSASSHAQSLRPRVLLTLGDTPYPADTGKRIRSRFILEALAAVADVDVVVISPTSDDAQVPPGVVVRSFTAVPLRWRSRMRSALRMLVSVRPHGIASPYWEPALSAVSSLGAVYDLVWFGGMHHADRLASKVRSHHVVIDVDDIESVKSRRVIASRDGRLSAGDALTYLDAMLWQRVERRLGRIADRLVVASAGDKEVLRAPDAVIVPNAYPDPGRAPGPSDEPVLLLVGNFRYPPNSDAAEFACRSILPVIRAAVPDARLVLVGHGDSEIAHLASVEGVEVVGPVDDVGTVLRQARVVVAPIRVGGGTRIKLIEAMAYALPSVTTTIGAEGLDVTDGVEVLIGDQATDFAAQCVRLLRDSEEARAVGARARERYLQSYQPSVPKQAVTDILNDSLGSVARP